ncbi:MAG: SRPBCC domain-containing protein [Ignavibacteriales bacterium]|nr:SRPBCC domain-containing protein [Ignavibacteriales bacterium]
MPKTIRQTVTFNASPNEVFELLMDSKKHSKFSGEKATISRKIGGKFSAYDGYCFGTNLELVQDKKIVQTWQTTGWKESEISRVTFVFTKVNEGTRLTFTHSGVPDYDFASIKEGWKEFYWEPMKRALEK